MTTAPSSRHASIAEAISAVIDEMPALGKDSQAPQAMGGYAYRSIEAIVAAVRPLVAKHGITIVPHVEGYEYRPAPGQKESWQDVVLTVRYDILHGDECVTARVVGIGRDSADKGANKAMTQAFKALLTQVFMVGEGDDVEAHDLTRAAADVPADVPIADWQRAMLRDAFDRAENLDDVKVAWVEATLPAIDRMVVRRIPDAVNLLRRCDLLTEAEAATILLGEGPAE